MARISSYPIDSTIQDKDAWIGTESTNRATRNFTAEDMAAYVVTSTSGITGSGTTNYMTMWTGSTSIGDSPMKMIQSISSGVNILTLGTDTDFDRVTFEATAEFQGGVRDQGGNLGTAGQILSSTGLNAQWVDPSAAITILTPHFQIATPGGSATYTQSNNIVDFDWSGGSGTYEYILPSATAIPYRKIRFVNNSTITASDKIHITAPGSETIDGGAFYEINKPYNGCAVWSDGVQWIVIQAKA